MNLADMMGGLRSASAHNSRIVSIALTQREIGPILSEYDNLLAEIERLKSELRERTKI